MSSNRSSTNSAWLLKGLKEYTKSGYLSSCQYFTASDLDVNCSGRSYMITGSNSGIGKSTAMQIAKRGGRVHLVCRNQQRGEEACEEMKTVTGSNDVHLHLLDMSKPKDVVAFARKFEQSGEALNVLVNNAGCMVHTRVLQEDGIETNFATNTLGTHLLTVCLIPLLERSEDPRVVIVSSAGMLVHKLDYNDFNFEDMRPFDGAVAYSQNKRQQVVLAQQYTYKYPKVQFYAMHPGWADTPALRSSMPDFYEKMKEKLRSAEQGADTALWLAISPSATKHASGLFFQDRKPVGTHLPQTSTRSSPEEEQTFMKTLEEFSSKFLISGC